MGVITVADFNGNAIDAIISTFLDQLSAHFRNAAVVAENAILIRMTDVAVLVTVSRYSEPGLSEPDQPFVLRVHTGPTLWIPPKLLDALGFPERPARLRARLELSLLPDELAAASRWLAEWLTRFSENTASPPEPPFVLHDVDAAFRPGNGANYLDWKRLDYLWTLNAKVVYQSWESDYTRRKEAAEEFGHTIHPDRYPVVTAPLKRPHYCEPEYPDDWPLLDGVDVAERFRSGGDFGKYLYGAVVDKQLLAACERGYILLPENWTASEFWRAWNDTWWEFCQIPRARRPFIRLVVGKDETPFGRTLKVEWDWITLDPKNDPSEDPAADPRYDPSSNPAFAVAWETLARRITDYVHGLPEPLKKSVSGSADSRLFRARIGELAVSSGWDAPIRWIIDWIGDFQPLEYD
ncbi:MAG: hypothetical protein ACM3NO_11320 [Deltaproteobacteria bacterium]